MLYKFMGGTEFELVDVFNKAVIAGSLKFTGAHFLNDPCEFRYESVKPSHQQFTEWHATYEPERTEEELANAWRELDDDSSDFNTNYAPREHLMSSTYVLCLSHNWDEMTMWVHYASGQTGFVVIYRDEIVQKIASFPEFGHCGNVGYSDEVPKLRWFSGPPEEMTHALLSTKSLAWKNETEFRTILIEHLGNASIFRRIDPTLIAGVVIGPRAPKSLIEIAKAHRSKQPDFSVHLARPSMSTGKMVLVEA
ncbi:TPA: DUF2971 domain-containing protein [Stenotrophomonas maltophilia]|nr:DUF2971 domain-containing protein [Stenotrophomonas maltophilia]HDS0951746.1 DUF2971 domain-containing protein [Stenotrophomonas maltophilia]HDS1025432.1 DUF2971 domain-containing protein [Stenotrophomonas maltophilia]HDS1028169.1 DUF2971 domain-containing protein [Stenotrophomonas maltophilia]HDS1029682.1 DUF2971 domain-containing protein [Stenotrophomonas maltophilia]